MSNRIHCLALLVALLFAGAHTAQAQEYYFDDWTPRTFAGVSDYEEQAPPSAAPTVTVTVDHSDTLAIVPSLIFGNNAVSYQGPSHDVPERLRHYRNANLSVLRFPGGNLSNNYFWDAPFSSDLPDDIDTDVAEPWPADDWWKMTPEGYYALLDEVDAEGIISVNYSYARYGTSENPVQKAAAYAAEWVREANVERGAGIEFWEVGNENFGSWQTGHTVPGKGTISGAEYGRDFCVFADSMRAVDPSIKVGAVTAEQPISWDPVYGQWNQLMFPEIADCADFLSVHYYFGPRDSPSNHAQRIISDVDKIGEISSHVRDQWESITGKEPIPLAMTEYNMWSDYDCDEDTNCQFAVGQLNSVVFALAFGKLIENKFALATAWNLENGWAGGRDHGLLANDNEPGVTPDTPHGPFFTYYYFTRVFGDVMVDAEVDGGDVEVFASRFNSGESGLVVVNPTANDHVVRLLLDDVELGDRYYWWAVQTDDPNSRKIYVNGETGTQEGGGPDDYEDVAAFSRTIGEDGEIVIDAPRYGTYYVAVEAGGPVAVEDVPETPAYALDIYPNPSRDRVTLQYGVDVTQQVDVRLYDVTGRLVRQLAPEQVVRGTHTARLDVSGLPAGLYFCQVRFEEAGTVTRKIAVVE